MGLVAHPDPAEARAGARTLDRVGLLNLVNLVGSKFRTVDKRCHHLPRNMHLKTCNLERESPGALVIRGAIEGEGWHYRVRQHRSGRRMQRDQGPDRGAVGGGGAQRRRPCGRRRATGARHRTALNIAVGVDDQIAGRPGSRGRPGRIRRADRGRRRSR
jgi:hypothetical protein